MIGFAMLAQTEARLAARDVGGLLIPFGLPLLILVMNGAALDDAEAATVFETVIVPVSLALVVAMMTLGGGFGPVDALPESLPTIGEHTPFGAAVGGMSASWAGGAHETPHVVALAATTLAAAVTAARVFRWE